MKKLIVLMLFLVSCGPNSPYFAGADMSVGCLAYPVSDADVGWEKKKEVIKVTANSQAKPGMFINAIIGQHFPAIPAIYTVSGRFTVPAVAKNEGISVNVQWIENETEYFSEFFWHLNPWNTDLYGWITTRTTLDGTRIKLFQIPVNSAWHEFEIVSDHINHITKSITIDGNTASLDLQMGSIPKLGFPDGLNVLLETTNMYTSCSPLNTFVGKSEWKSVKLQ